MGIEKNNIYGELTNYPLNKGRFLYKHGELPSGAENIDEEEPNDDENENPDQTPEVAERARGGIPITDQPEKPTESESEQKEQEDSAEDAKEEAESSEESKEKDPAEFIPERPPEALSGTEFAEQLQDLERQTVERLRSEGKTPDQIRMEQFRVREQAIYEQIVKGNIPDKMREFKEVPVKTTVNGQKVEGTIRVMPDYLMIGSNEDAVRVPMTAMTAQLIARQMNCTLPTDHMVDAIAREAEEHGHMINPQPQGDSRRFMSTEYFLRHDQTIRRQLSGVSGNPLIVGDKKDIIVPYGSHGENNVVIYGWHQPNGHPIQPYSGPHHAWFYLDYSHGVRLVSQQMTIKMPNGETVNARVSDVLRDRLPDGSKVEGLHRLLASASIENSENAYRHAGLVREIDISELQKSQPPAQVADATVQEDTNGQATPSEQTEQPADQTANQTVLASSGGVSGGGMGVGGGGGSYGGQPAGGGVSYGSEPTYTAPGQSASAGEKVPSTNIATPAIETNALNIGKLPGLKRAKNPYEFSRLNSVPPLQGPTGFFGDSINTAITNAEYLSGQGHEYFAKGGKRTDWLLTSIEKNQENIHERIKKLQRAVVLIGTNDIGMGGSETPDVIFSRIEAIWELIRHINPNIKLYACTIPPFGNYEGYRSRKHIVDKRRAEINAKIRASAKSNPAINLIDLCLPVEEGGLAVAGNPPDGDALDKSVCWEPLHPDKNALAMVYGREIHNNEGTGQSVDPGASSQSRQVERRTESTNEVQQPEIAGNFEKNDEFNEYVQTYNYPENATNGLSVHINKPGNFDSSKPTRVIVYALPAGNTIPQTVGKAKTPGDDWHFDIQHIGAQTRRLRQINSNENIIVAYVQGPQKSMSDWLKNNQNGKDVLDPMLADIKMRIGAPNAAINLSSHSNGGSMIRAIVENQREIPDSINRLSFLDSINTFSAEKYGTKVLNWLQNNNDHHLSIVSYDDRNALLNGKPFPGRGSSYARTMEMIQFFKDNGVDLNEENRNGHKKYTGLNGQINIAILKNPHNAILHTETVRRNGFIYAETAGTSLENAAPFNGPIAYQNLIQTNAVV